MNLKLKSSWDQITLEDYCFLQSLINDENLEEFEREIRILCLLAGVEESFFNEYSLSDVKELFQSIAWLNDEPKGDIQEYYVIGGKEYRLTQGLSELKAAQFVDLSNLIKDKDQILDNLHSICATLLLPTVKLSRKKRLFNRLFSIANSTERGRKILENRHIKAFSPETEKYMQTPIDETAENIFKNISVTQALGISSFFFALSVIFIECSLDYSEQTMTKELKSVLMNLKTELETKERKETKMIEKNLQELEHLVNIGDG